MAEVIRQRSQNEAVAAGGGVQTAHPPNSPRNSDTDYELPNGANLAPKGKRDIKLPSPAPIVHDDVLPWHVKLMDIIGITNPENMDREKQYWGCAYRWKITDQRLKNTKTPKDIIGLEMKDHRVSSPVWHACCHDKSSFRCLVPCNSDYYAR